MAKLEVGQKLWFVPDDRYSRFAPDVAKGEPRYVDILNVDGDMIDIGFGRYTKLERSRDGFAIFVYGNKGEGLYGQCYVDGPAWIAEHERQRAWRDFQKVVRVIGPQAVTTDAIYQAAALLGVEMPERASGAADKGGLDEPA